MAGDLPLTLTAAMTIYYCERFIVQAIENVFAHEINVEYEILMDFCRRYYGRVEACGGNC
jgi:hypothetical protein